MSQSKLIHLAADLSHYHTDYLWKMPGSWEGYPYYSSPEFYEDIARIASRGIMDMLFFGDSGGTPEDYGGNHHTAVRYGAKWPRHDMMPMIPCMSRVAEGVGFGITMSTTYHHPFHIARDVQRARSRHQGPHRLERGDLALQERGGELRLQEDDRARRALRARAGAPAGLLRALGQRRARRHRARPRERYLRRFPKRCISSISRANTTACAGRCPRCRRRSGRPVIIQAGQSGPGMDLAAHYADLQFSTRRTTAEHEGASRPNSTAGSPSSAASRATAASCGRCASRLRTPKPQAQRDGGALSRFDSAGSRPDRTLVDVWARFLAIPRATCGSPTSPPR